MQDMCYHAQGRGGGCLASRVGGGEEIRVREVETTDCE